MKSFCLPISDAFTASCRNFLWVLGFGFAAHAETVLGEPLDFRSDTLKIQMEWDRCIGSGKNSPTFELHCRYRKEQAWELELKKLFDTAASTTDSIGKLMVENYERQWMGFRKQGFDFCAATYLTGVFGKEGKIQNLECRIALIRQHAVKVWRSMEVER